MYSPGGSFQAVIQDSGPASGGQPGLGLSELLGVSRSPNANSGTGPLGTHACWYDAPITTGGYHYICFDPNAQGGGLIAYGNAGTAPQESLQIAVNGTAYPFPFVLSGIAGPSVSTPNDLMCWNNSNGTLAKDCGEGSSTINFGNQLGTGICLGCNTALGLNGLDLAVYGNGSWGYVQPSTPLRGGQWQVYSTFATARAAASGSATLVLSSGATVNPAWIGLPFGYYVPDGGGFGLRYYVQSVNVGANSVTLTNLDASTPTFSSGNGDFFFGADVNVSVVNCSGSTCTWVSGEQFSPFAAGGTTAVAVIGGTDYVINSSTATTLSLATSAGTQTGVSMTQYTWDFDTATNYRAQLVAGSWEENLFIGARAIGDFEIRGLQSGVGQFHPLVIGNGFSGSPTNFLYDQIVENPDGMLSLGGSEGGDTLRVQPTNDSAATNYLYMPTPYTGDNIALSARTNGSDSAVNINFDTLGTGATIFTSHTFGYTEFAIYGAGHADYPTAASGSGSAVFGAASGTDTNVNVQMLPKGTGIVLLGNLCTASGSTPQTCNDPRGIVTTSSLSTAASTLAADYVIDDSSVTGSSMVQCTIDAYSGTWHTNGVPVIAACIPGSGTITVKIQNVDTANALSGTVGIGFAVLN